VCWRNKRLFIIIIIIIIIIYFWIFNFLQFAIDGKNNSKKKVQKVFFFIFMSSYAEMSFLK
jgi:uncharacterized protein (UPF0333 family)